MSPNATASPQTSSSDTTQTQAQTHRTFSEPTPLPKRQLIVVYLVQFGEPISFTVLFPFMYFSVTLFSGRFTNTADGSVTAVYGRQVRDFHITDDPTRIGYYVGLLAASFAVAQFFSGLPWGFLSDRIGRRPVILFGLAGTTICLLLFGLSVSFAWAMTVRIMTGLVNGNVGVLKSVLGEITDETNQARAFSYMPMVYGIGFIAGPTIGGLLSNPAETYPD
ncbi:major facilitator superfamily domain-containing protein, partial [Thamnocephalis sphaerospora]